VGTAGDDAERPATNGGVSSAHAVGVWLRRCDGSMRMAPRAAVPAMPLPDNVRVVLRAEQVLQQAGWRGDPGLAVKLHDLTWTRARWEQARAHAREQGNHEAMATPWKDLEVEEGEGEERVVLGRHHPSSSIVKGRPVDVHVNGLALVVCQAAPGTFPMPPDGVGKVSLLAIAELMLWQIRRPSVV
jgi:hypothetical protein